MSRALFIHAPHDLRVEAFAPGEPGPGEVLVRMGAGGICGSDLHYFHQGGFGAVRLRQPMVLGHEIAGTIAALGPGVTSLAVGDAVAVNPSLPCGTCRFCREGVQQHCLDMRFFGSAMRMPHVHGGFRDALVCEAVRCVALPPGLSVEVAAFAEPLAVCLHAAAQAGPLLGKRVLVTGAGPIGVLSVAVARLGGAAEIVVTDLVAAPLGIAAQMGADRTIALREQPDALAPYAADKGYFDVVIEASGSGAALLGAIEAARPRATIVQLGIGDDVALPLGRLVAKEITLRGTFRFHAEFAAAVAVLARGAIDPRPMVTAQLPLDRAAEAFALASDRGRAMKVQLAFEKM
ncbi:L-idonate 5-dehydrogenase [Humitalea rosea]|uniref:L-idonate 5-dehydrogenase n=1 Tax=Humitalea rosea TaxID=990373 RepID=A0A2W7IQZ1_9PROT|nr:L-idonate 5-dehydrogenase [Humitalea rosea]PZW48713.1 L-idonate 5-dehydrogenase [Humitalea rosea]